MTRLFFLIVLLFTHLLLSNAQEHYIIPQPASVALKSGTFTFSNSISISFDQTNEGLVRTSKVLVDKLTERGINATINTRSKAKASILLALNPSSKDSDKERYQLEVTPKQIMISAYTEAGLFYGVQSLDQLMPIDGSRRIPCIEIDDYPRFGWRGLMLDVSRHFFSVDDVKKYIDKMAEYKFNVFHWHLTDDEGWRIEIKSLPALTNKGAWRVERHGKFGEGRALPLEGEPTTYGGFYTQEQIKDIVAYAAARHITVVPEIDMPGHSMAMLAAFPHLSVNKKPAFVNPGSKFSEWYGDGTFKMLIENTLDPSNEEVYATIDKVMTEVATLFPGQYIHMGGDECYKGFWEADEKVKAFMKQKSIHDSHELQSYFVKRVEKIIASKGKTMIGWDEILEGGLAEGAVVMSWRGMKGGIEAAKLGHKVIMSPTTYAYLDYTQGDRSVETNIYADLHLEKCYEFEPLPADIDKSLILGGQGNLWTEAIPSIDYAMYMTYPRAFAIAESVWSPAEKKNWKHFVIRTEQHFSRFTYKNASISKAIYDPIISVTQNGNQAILAMKSAVENTVIKYSLNNTYPLDHAKTYQAPVAIPEGELFLRAQLFRDGKPLGRMLQISRPDLMKRVKKN